MQGLTMMCDEVVTELQQMKVMAIERNVRPFLSIEPLLGTLKTDVNNCEMVIVGAMTGSQKSRSVPKKQYSF